MSTATRLRLAVVIPAWNEAGNLPNTLKSLAAQTDPADRVVVVDGASTDETATIAEQHGASLLRSPRRGRGFQIAFGIEHVSEDVVVVAHADMTFSRSALAEIRRWLDEHPECPGGCLGHRFDERRWSLRAIEWWDDVRARLGGISYGDQAQFFRRKVLSLIGGFPDQPVMEDLELSLRLRQVGRPAYLKQPVVVSGRRFARLGYWRTVWANLRFRRAYRKHGVAGCARIYAQYYGVALGDGDVAGGQA